MSEQPKTSEKVTEIVKKIDPEIAKKTASEIVKKTPEIVEKTASEIVKKTASEIVKKTPEIVKKTASEIVKKTPEIVKKTASEIVKKTASEIVNPTPPSKPEMVSIRTRNRRFKEPKKLVISVSDEGFMSTDQEEEEEEEEKEEEKEEEEEQKEEEKEQEKEKEEQEKEEKEEEEQKKNQSDEKKPNSKRLSNFVKLNTSHTWIWYEFGDSLVDSAVQRGAYEMGSFMLEYCPQLKSRHLPRRGWQLLRRNLGKARRFSSSFIKLELQEVERSRRFVRQLQLAKPVKREEHAFLEQIYRGVSLPLDINAKVTTFLKGYGIVRGVIAGFQPEDSTYLVKCCVNGKTEEFLVPDIHIQSSEKFTGLPIDHLMRSIDPNEDIFKMVMISKGKERYSQELLEAMLLVMKLLPLKAKALQELTAKNESHESVTKPKKGQASSLGVTIMALHRVNADVLPPMRILHDYLKDYEKNVKLQTSKARTALERYLKCCHQAEIDLQNVENVYGLKVKVKSTRNLNLDLQTILYLTGELGGPNSDDIMLITDNLIAFMIKTLPPELSAQLEKTMNELKPLRLRILEKCKGAGSRGDQGANDKV